MALLAQKEGKTTFPLEKFYVEREKNRISILSKFTFGLSTGVGNTFFSHQLPGFSIYQISGQAPVLFDTQGLDLTTPPTIADLNKANRFTNWVNDASATNSVISGTDVIDVNTAAFKGNGNALNIPLKLTVHYEYKQFRIGAGYSYELMSLGSFKIASSDKSYTLSPTSTLGFMSKYFGLLGYSFYRIDKYLLTVDANIGNFSPGSNFNNALIQKSLYYNLGLTIEKDFSEYFKVFARPSLELKSYALAVGGKSIDHSMNAIYLNVGVTYRIPELPRCYNKDCRIQINHAHGNKEYRSRSHKIYEKQNPSYGENDPVLIKYKGKNKRKLNPY